MSGGHYDYLCHAWDIEDLLAKRQQLTDMGERLAGLDEREFPGSTALAQLTLRLRTQLQVWEAHVDATLAITRDVWKAVEWWDSCDWGPDAVREALTAAVVKAVVPEQEAGR